MYVLTKKPNVIESYNTKKRVREEKELRKYFSESTFERYLRSSLKANNKENQATSLGRSCNAIVHSARRFEQIKVRALMVYTRHACRDLSKATQRLR